MKNPKATPIANRFAEALEFKLNPVGTLATDYIRIEIKAGKTFDKIIEADAEGNWKECHAFILRETGELIKSATWSAPQKNYDGTNAVRYNLSNEREFLLVVNNADIYGSYLYADKAAKLKEQLS